MLLFFKYVALVAMIGIALVMLFPLGSGPFTATHGPVSALRAIANFALLLVIFCFLAAMRSGRLTSCIRQVIPFEPTEACTPRPILELRC
jgi:hypothetical protein